mmetsp:Transcript_7740/g.32017  ORF Transcript_7740/g.32017 Transcript_7740/m.32017 type:complete len:362 (-) Transcript_7740:51-1136(-)|eukprot:CAMPEP_0185709116 /NCGR_PEP_ID=MMETSP1164-20130828/27995_1 /TAXON_ID=1104430 /ORGANISM="Chrysoreinhardia sp, Strain CCMP2950" /LENGTH=361 /DNA_ID=CAMNT_0028376591 /DNA_START=16 /DNA_END=1101 /DNA_ORIENTATION=+
MATSRVSRPELTGPPELFYDGREARKYASSSRMIHVQAEIADRCIELLNLGDGGERRLILDIGCGSGLSGAALEAAGHEWIGCDISPDMLRIATERAADNSPTEAPSGDDDDDEDDEDDDDDEMQDDDDEVDDDDDDDEASASGAEEEAFAPRPLKKRRRRASATRTSEVIQHDMGLGLPFRDACFDGAISVSALQWLCYDNAVAQSAPKRLARFFGSLYRVLKRSSRAALQFYPESDAQAALVATAAARAGFAGGIVVDFPASARAKKHYLCLSMDRGYRKPSPQLSVTNNPGSDDVVKTGASSGVRASSDRRSKKKKRKTSTSGKTREWVVSKKEHQRRQGRDVRPDTKFTGRKRKDRF